MDSTNSKASLEAAIFDMDGVLTDTARLHARAWRKLLTGFFEEEAGRSGRPREPFDEEHDYRRHLEGRTVAEGVPALLEARGIELPAGRPDDPPGARTVWGLVRAKDEAVARWVAEAGVTVLPGMVGIARDLHGRGVPLAVVSSSRNCAAVLEGAGIAGLFAARVDGETLRNAALPGKPEPDGFLEAAARLGILPRSVVVFEDSPAGVTAARRGGFGLVVGAARDVEAGLRLREAGADLIVDPRAEPSVRFEELEGWFAYADDRRPHALARWDAFMAELDGREPALFLDYDGTLAPIASRPSEAVLPTATRAVVERLAERFAVTLVSGRAREDVASLAGLRNASYAGSHGFDIEVAGDGAPVLRHRVAEELLPVVAEAAEHLRSELAEVEGALVEPKGFTVAVHHRLVGEGDLPRVESAVDRALERYPGLRKALGKKVFELRPDLEWDKGRAVEWLIAALGLDRPEVVPVYVGDDETDEDAFRALRGRGIGILVTSVPRPTGARFSLQDPGEVREFLRRLAERS